MKIQSGLRELSKKYLPTSRYLVEHIIKESSKLSDYDYDSDHPSRRFYSTYIHNLIFRDPITDNIVLSIEFSSIECAQILNVLYQIVFTFNQTQSFMRASSISGIYISGTKIPANLVIYASGDLVFFNIFISNNDKNIVVFNVSEIQSLINLLESELLEDLYIVDYSE